MFDEGIVDSKEIQPKIAELHRDERYFSEDYLIDFKPKKLLNH